MNHLRAKKYSIATRVPENCIQALDTNDEFHEPSTRHSDYFDQEVIHLSSINDPWLQIDVAYRRGKLILIVLGVKFQKYEIEPCQVYMTLGKIVRNHWDAKNESRLEKTKPV